MCGNRDLALTVLETCLGSLKGQNNKDMYEQSEILMYKAMLLDESGQLAQTLTFLETFESMIVDRIGMLEHKASLLLRLKQFGKARAEFQTLLDLNPECYDYHKGLQACVLEISDVSGMSGCELPAQKR
jgi:peptide alpha-N-acetyltransferase